MAFAAADGLLVDVNEAFMRLTGYAREDVINRIRFQDIMPPEYRQANQKAVEEMLKGGLSRELDEGLICKDGSSVPIHMKIFVVRAADGMMIGMGASMKERSNMEASRHPG
jgi:PAS domain S-box-containing protein